MKKRLMALLLAVALIATSNGFLELGSMVAHAAENEESTGDTTVEEAPCKGDKDEKAHKNVNISFLWNGFECKATVLCKDCEETWEDKECSIVQEITTQPTCTKTGVRKYTASIEFAEKTYTDICPETEVVPKAEHNYEKNKDAVEPTCTAVGHTEQQKCAVCGALKGWEEIPVLPHTEGVSKEAVAPTCTETGLTEEISCTVCQTVLTPATEVPATGHTYEKLVYSWGNNYATCTASSTCVVCKKVYFKKSCNIESEVTTQPTCTEKGVRTYTASVMYEGKEYSDVQNEKIDALGHDEKEVVSFKWNKDHTCTAVVLCQRCDTNVENPAKVDIDTTNAATCSEDGEIVYTASYEIGTQKFSNVYREHDEAGHKEEVTITAKEATCDTSGRTEEVKCSVCGEVLKESKVIKAKGHTPVVSKEAKEPTCTVDGNTEEKTCTVCGKVTTKAKAIEATGHTKQVTKEAKAATCTEAGNTEEVKCAVCNTTLTASRTLKAKGHTEEVTKEAKAVTCTEDGYTEEKTCTVCKVVTAESKPVKATGHTSTVTKDAKDATCTEAGWTEEKTCSVCKTVTVVSNEIPAKGHKESITKSAKAPTCTEVGWTEEKTCIVCNEVTVTSNEVAATGHTEKVTKAAKAASCTEAGWTEEKTCSVCNVVTAASTVINATGHKEVVSNPAKAPKCDEAGWTEERSCSVCKEILVASEVVPAGHTYLLTDVEWSTDFKVCMATIACEYCDVKVKNQQCVQILHETDVEPTCTEPGGAYYSARFVYDGKELLSEKALDESTIVPALGHDYEGDFCIRCGAEKPEAKIVFVKTQSAKDYTGSAVKVNDNIYEVKRGTGDVTFEYYTDATCSIPTFSGDDEREATAPVKTGTYYVKALISEDEEHKASETLGVHKFVIRPRRVGSLKAVNQASTIKLTWAKVPEAEGYIIYRRLHGTDVSAFKAIKTINSNSTLNYTDSNIAQNKRYIYNIVAVAANDNKSAMRANGTQIVRMKIISTENQNGSVKVTWTKVANAAGYKVYRKAAGSDEYGFLTNIKNGATTSYTDKYAKTIRNGKASTYYVVAYYKDSSSVVLKTNTKTHYYVERPTISAVESNKTKTLKVTWKKNSAATGYQVRYSTKSSMDNAKTANVTSLSKTWSGLTKNKTYYVQVRAYKTVNGTKYWSAWSAKKSKKVK